MKIYTYPIRANSFEYSLNPFWGFTLIFSAKKERVYDNLSVKAMEAIQLCDNPYLMKNNELLSNSATPQKNLNALGKLFVYVAQINFFLLRKIPLFVKPRFNDASEAIYYFRKNIYPDKQKNLCLARAFFAASMSKNFKKSGVIIIGLFLPSRSLHAWVIENGTNPDYFDTEWINFKPIAIIC